MSQVSIIIPVFNSEKSLPRCLNSIKAQTYDDFEVIMVNDGSTDNSAQICAEYCKEDSRFKLFNQENSGPSVARNKGIEEAASKYLSFVDSDDWIEPDFIEQFYNAAEETDADLTICSYVVESNNGSEKRKSSYSKPGLYEGQACREIALNSICGRTKGICAFSVVRFIKREIFKTTGYMFNMKVHRSEDYLLWTQIAFKVNRVCMITDKHLYHYVMNEESITHSYIKDCWKMVKTIFDELRSTLPQEDEVIKNLNYAFIIRTYTALHVAALADDKKTFWQDFNEIIHDRVLSDVVKSLHIRDVSERHRNSLIILKFRLYFLLRLVYLKKFYSAKKH